MGEQNIIKIYLCGKSRRLLLQEELMFLNYALGEDS